MRGIGWLFLLPPAILWSQSDTASLSGSVTDPATLGVMNAKVTLRNTATGSQRLTVTDVQGLYHFSLLVPGPYEMTVEAPGFMQHKDSNLTLQVAQAARLDVQLTVGSPTSLVEVKNDMSPLNADTVAQGTVVGPEKILSLPLNGRQFLQLALLVPGANGGGRMVQQNQNRCPRPCEDIIGGLSISGNRTNNTSFLLDGATNIDPDYSALSYSPPIDAVFEFQVQTAMFGAEYGRAGGQINVATRSGTNEIHGSAWEFLRNNKLDARPFNLPTPEVPKFQRNQFGATAGGPIVRDKLFYFGSYEGLRIRKAGAGLTTVPIPSALQRVGDFSETKGGIYDPDTLQNGVRQPFPGFQIPGSRLDPLALAALNALPLPNVPGGALFVNANGVLQQNSDNYSGRIDHIFSRKIALFGRYSVSNEDAVIPQPVSGRDNINQVRPQNAGVGVTVLLPSVVNETRVGFSRYRQINGLPEPEFTVNGQKRTLPQFIVSTLPYNVGGAGQFVGTTAGGIVLIRDNTFQISDNASWQHGRHSVKFGGEIYQVRYNRIETPGPIGNYQFTSGFTTSNDGKGGDALASMLLALPALANRSIGPSRIDGRQPSYALYVQDNVRLSRRLMLNIGLRYELTPPMYDTRQQMSSIDYSDVPTPATIFAQGRTAFYQPRMFVCGLSGYPKGCAFSDRNNFAPRLGVVWSMSPRTVVRAGAGVFYANNDLNPLFRLAAGLPTNLSQTLNSDPFIPRFHGYDIFGPAVVGPGQKEPVQAAGIDLHQRSSYSMQWDFSVQRELRRDIAFEAGYQATLGVKLEQNVQPNNSRPGPGAVGPRRPYQGLRFALDTKFPPYFTVVGESVPVGFINYFPHSAQSNYHSLFLRLEKRFSGGLSWLTSYTFSKAITNAPQLRNAGGINGSENSPPQDSFNLREERGLAAFDTRHRLVNSFVYELPFGRGKRYLQAGWVSRILGGWETSGIVTAQSGFPFTINLKGDTAGVGAGTGGIFVRPIAVPGVAAALSGSQRSTSMFFNTAAFVLPPTYSFGNVGRNTVIGPRMFNIDFMMVKQVKLTEPLSLQFRGEVFNLFNHSNYNLVGRIINDPKTFGQILNQFDPRELQFGIKAIF